MNQNTFLMGLQMPEKITLHEIKNLLFDFNQTLKTNNDGYVQDASLHEKKTPTTQKTLMIISVFATTGKTAYDILSKFPQFSTFKRYIISEISNIYPQHHAENTTIPFEQFCNTAINETNTIYQPSDAKPTCLTKAMYNHYYCISGDVIWFNGNPVNMSKGKFFARQLYCELFLDAIKTVNGFKISSESMVFIEDENAMPHFQDKQLILPVEEVENTNSIPEIMTTNYKMVMN